MFVPTHVRFALPAPTLAALIPAYYFVTVPEQPQEIEDLIPPEWGCIRVTGEGHWHATATSGAATKIAPVVLVGPTAVAVRIRSRKAETIGFGLTPLGWAWLVGSDASALANTHADLDGEFEGLAAALLELIPLPDDARVAGLNALLGERFAARPRPEEADMIIAISRALQSETVTTVDDFAAAVSISDRHLRRLCLRHFGFAPKLLLRRQRFLRALTRLREQPEVAWHRLIGSEFSDQAHFTREFRHFMWQTPTAFFARRRAIQEQAARVRQAVVGAGFQVLDKPLAGSRRP